MVRGEGQKGRGEVRREEEERERTKRKVKEERDKSKVKCAEKRRAENKENIKQKGAEERGERNCQREERRRRRQRVYFLAHCWELFFTFYLAVRLVWPKIRVDFFLPCTWASEKLSHGWQSIIFFSYTWVFSNAGPQFAVKLCFFYLGVPFQAKLEAIILLPCLWAFHIKPAKFTKSYGFALVIFTILG